MIEEQQRTRTTVPLFAAFIIILAISAACSQKYDKSTTDSRSRSDFTDKTEERMITVEIKPRMRKNKLHIKINLDSGACSWTLQDPKGEIIWQDSVSGKTNFNENRELPLTPGKWKLNLSLDNASGRHDIKWTGSN